MAYNSYVILDDKIAIMDSVDAISASEWLGNLAGALDGRAPDYLIVQHMEPDHSANITRFMDAYPAAKVVASAKAFDMMANFYGESYEDRRIVVKEGDELSLGRHTLRFIAAPMVHWPEVMMTYDSTTRCCSPPTRSASSARSTSTRTGRARRAATTSASSASSASRCRRC